LRLRHSRLRAVRRMAMSTLAVIGGGLGVYAVLAIVFHAFVEPSLGTTTAGYKAPPANVASAGEAAKPAPSLAPAPAPAPAVEATARPSLAVAAVAPEFPVDAVATEPKIEPKTEPRTTEPKTELKTEPKTEPKSEPRPVATRTHRYRSRHYWNSWNAWGFSGSFGRRRWF
jgi:outer membrane biosynthesis protein TonB